MCQFEKGFYHYDNLDRGQVLRITKVTKQYVWAETYWRWEIDDQFDKRWIKDKGVLENANFTTSKHGRNTYAKDLVPLTSEEIKDFLTKAKDIKRANDRMNNRYYFTK